MRLIKFLIYVLGIHPHTKPQTLWTPPDDGLGRQKHRLLLTPQPKFVIHCRKSLGFHWGARALLSSRELFGSQHGTLLLYSSNRPRVFAAKAFKTQRVAGCGCEQANATADQDAGVGRTKLSSLLSTSSGLNPSFKLQSDYGSAPRTCSKGWKAYPYGIVSCGQLVIIPVTVQFWADDPKFVIGGLASMSQLKHFVH